MLRITQLRSAHLPFAKYKCVNLGRNFWHSRISTILILSNRFDLH
jgi:hypothetical protein